MFRKLAGSSLALALIAIVAMKHVALGFCLCQEQIVTNPDTCCQPAEAIQTCCGSEAEEPTPAPCDDCIIDLEIEVSDFLWSSDEFSPAKEIGTPVAVPTGDLASIPGRVAVFTTAAPVRGSPPGLPPLYLRQSVLRL